MIRIELEASSYSELVQKLKKLLGNMDSAPQTEVSKEEPKKKATKKKTKKKKAPNEKQSKRIKTRLAEEENNSKEKESQELQSEKEPSSDSQDVDRETLKKVLQEVTTLHGMAKARSLLAKYMAKKISDLKPENFGPLYIDCRQVLAEPEAEGL